MTVPATPLPVPAVVRRIADGRSVHPVWVNELGGVTFRVGDDFVKVSPTDVVGEARRLRWARRYVQVPEVLGVGDGWLHTRGLPGRSAVDPRWLSEAATAIRAIGAGLRMLHDQLPTRSCPFDWSAGSRLALLAPEQRADLGEPPPVDKLVVCHGDACAPNTLIDDDGRCCGHVDLGDLGVADRWADLAVATLSLQWNYPGRCWDDEFFAAYGVDPDPLRIDHYRRLWSSDNDRR